MMSHIKNKNLNNCISVDCAVFKAKTICKTKQEKAFFF